VKSEIVVGLRHHDQPADEGKQSESQARRTLESENSQLLPHMSNGAGANGQSAEGVAELAA
jgi:hypothetical protein